jgi:predicted porin
MTKLIASVFAFSLAMTAVASAEMTPDEKAAMAALQAQVNALTAAMAVLQAQQKAQPVAKPPVAPAPAAPAGSFISLVPNPAGNIILNIGGEQVQVYGNIDLSYDATTKGFQSFYPTSGDSPVGNNSYMSAISTNLSYIGVRGDHKIGKRSGVVYQLETALSISSTPGTVNTNSNNSGDVAGGLVSRNSYVGLRTPSGMFKIGKTDAPYKTSTSRMNPFLGKLGDYSVVMGNSGGDNRVEFGTRMDHSIWWESPSWGGFTVNLLASPGQNRASDTSNIASGEASCTGGNLPGSGALPPMCNDGSWAWAYSGSMNYQMKKLYLTAAYEAHKRVNRTSDMPNLDPNDVGDETAVKGGFQYAFSPQTSISAIYESMQRFLPTYLTPQNERTRDGFWLTGTQVLSKRDTFSLGWARANPSPGDPGQHNTPALYPNAANPTLFGTPNPDNMANMYTALITHSIDRHFSLYADWALTLNHPYAHYDLGAGGRGLTTDCHDASTLAAFDPTANGGAGGVTGNGPHCYAGGRLQGFSFGVDLKF